MALSFLISVGPQSIDAPPPDSLDLKQIAYFGRVLLKGPTLNQALAFLENNFSLLDVLVDATVIENVGDIVDILNAGAASAFVTLPQLSALSSEQNVPSSRLVATLCSADDVAALQSWVAENPERREIGVHSAAEPAIDPLVSELGDNSVAKTVYRSYSRSASLTNLLVNEQEQVMSVIPSTALSVDQEDRSPAKLLVSGASPDATTGLYATVVTDERGVTLGFVWSSEKSITEALRTGQGVYQSRKRGLWYKGASSGDVQELVRVGLDCDSDCLLFVVKQKGKGHKYSRIHFLYIHTIRLANMPFNLQASATLGLPAASVRTLVFRVFRKRFNFGRKTLLLVLTPHGFSMTKNSLRRKLWRRLRNSARLPRNKM